ncbi:MAG: precorrin-6y C5,15-methyltransferase (decarboxylating) subunit CbiE [Pirellulaceae bacterium]
MANKVHIIGIGDDGVEGLTAAARGIIDDADLVLGGEQAVGALSSESVACCELANEMEALIARIGDNPDKRIVVLATGDPLFYGTARFLCDRLGKDRFEVVPHVSTMQLAFARVKESWDEAYLTNLANQTLDRVVERVRTAEKVGMFTSESAPPDAVAQALLDRQIDYFTAFVCENLGSPDERVTQCDLPDVAAHQFSPLNVMILVRKPNVPDRPSTMIGQRLFGNPDEAFLQSKPKRGLLTPAEVRSIALAELDIGPSSIVWDVGAGSGSVAVEAAQIAVNGHVHAIEMDAEDHQLISANAKRFGITNLTAVLGKAPEAWDDLPDADAIFVGGTGRTVHRIVEVAYDRLRPRGRMVANVASIQNVGGVYDALQSLAGEAQVFMINIARGTPQFDRLRFESLNPTFLVSAIRG